MFILICPELPSKVQSEALIGFSAALSGETANTSSIPEGPSSVETHYPQ